jgi:hypothetical protein
VDVYPAGVTQVVMSAWTTSVPLRSMTLTGTTSSVPSVKGAEVGWIDASGGAQRRGGLLQVPHGHGLGNPAVTCRHGGLHEHAHRHLGGIARRDRVHRM